MIEDLSRKLRAFANERDWEQFHSPKNLSMALSVESSELLEIFQWLTQEQSRNLSPAQLESVEEEVGDIVNYLILLCDHLDLDLLECAQRKIEINRDKYPAERVRGSSKKYTAYKNE